MYKHYNIDDLIQSSENAATLPIERFGMGLYVESMPDIVGPDIYIDPADKVGIEIARNFCLKMAEHYKKIKENIHNPPA